MNNFLVYSISTNGEVFYIGRTCDLHRRKLEHLNDKSKTYKANKINKLKRIEQSIEFNILHYNVSYDESVSLEVKEIKEHKEAGFQLTNLTEGGEGLNGVNRDFTEEWKNNLKKARKALFDDGYIVANKGKTLEELIGDKKAKEQKERVGKKISEGIKSGKINHNKGKTIEEIVGEERAYELRKISSNIAKKTFSGTKQSKEHIDKRVKKQKETILKRSEEEREKIRKLNKINGAKSIKYYNFCVDGFKHYGTWKSLSNALYEQQNIKVSPVSLSDFYRGKYKSLKCGIKSIKILTQEDKL